MTRWICIYQPHTGMAELGNVAIVERETVEEAREWFVREVMGHVWPPMFGKRDYEVMKLDDLPSGWSYYR